MGIGGAGQQACAAPQPGGRGGANRCAPGC